MQARVCIDSCSYSYSRSGVFIYSTYIGARAEGSAAGPCPFWAGGRELGPSMGGPQAMPRSASVGFAPKGPPKQNRRPP
jgi:hypothetical protein